MKQPVWIDRRVVSLIHEAQLAEHGGASGVRDEQLLTSALDGPKNLFHYGDPDLYELAACYGWRLVSNHPFVDGNKRTAWVCTRLFLRLNGLDIEAPAQEKIKIMLRLASGQLTDAEFSEWLRNHGKLIAER